MTSDTSLSSLHCIVWMALLAALVAAGAFIKVPLPPIPFTLQTFFVLLAGLLLGPVGGALCLLLYLAVGVLGLPVFSGGGSGLGHLMGPTGGFLVGFVLAAGLAGMARKAPMTPPDWGAGLAWGALGTLTLLGCGVAWLVISLDFTWGKAVTAGMLPFLPGAIAKLVLAVGCARVMARRRLGPL